MRVLCHWAIIIFSDIVRASIVSPGDAANVGIVVHQIWRVLFGQFLCQRCQGIDWWSVYMLVVNWVFFSFLRFFFFWCTLTYDIIININIQYTLVWIRLMSHLCCTSCWAATAWFSGFICTWQLHADSPLRSATYLSKHAGDNQIATRLLRHCSGLARCCSQSASRLL